ncbi:MAG: DUF362 domain-containing protein [Methanoregulaceae archaeon]|nr:DUF362 domain-containing protein [Methanoregulaceae archaeon]
MSSKVYFSRRGAGNDGESTTDKIRRLFDAAGLGDCIHEGDLTAVKVHFGEKGNDTYINPVYVRQVVEKIRMFYGKPFVTDTNTLYNGSRHNTVDHLTTAAEHGFSPSVTGAPVIISDGLRGDHFRMVRIDGKHFIEVKIGGDIASADSMIVLSHVKGHCMAGFGGAVKNLGMGCAPIPGKADQHRGMCPAVNQATCSACGKCMVACRQSAVSIKSVAEIEKEHCIGCGECIAGCPTGSLGYDWKRDLVTFMEMLTEHAFGAIKGKEDRVGFMNFLLDITPDCDCVPWSDSPIVPDIGILASRDPVAIDAASVDLVNSQSGISGTRILTNLNPGEDKFRGVWESTDGLIQVRYGQEIGLGSGSYELIEI